MGWPAIFMVVSAASTIYGGIASSNAARAEARRAQQYAWYNAYGQQKWGITQAQLSLMAASMNASLIQQQAEYNTKINDAWIGYNIHTLYEVDEYNKEVYDEQIDQIFTAAGLSQEQLHIDYAKARGHTIANQSASGITIGEAGAQTAIIENMAEEALFSFIIENNMNNQADAIRNAQAKGTWETEMAVNKIMYEGQLSNAASYYNAQANARSTLISGALNAYTAMVSGQNQAVATLYGGAQTAANQNAQASMYLTQGLIGGASTIAQYGLQNYNPGVETTPINQYAIYDEPHPAGASYQYLTSPSSRGVTGNYGQFGSLLRN